MVILYSFPHRLGLPGIGTTAFKQIEALRQLGHEVIVFAASYHAVPQGPGENRATMALFGRRIPQRLIGVDRSYSFHDLRVAWALGGLQGKIDAIHCWPLGSLKTAEKARILGIPTFLERPNTHTQHAYEVVSDECRRIGFVLADGHSHAENPRRLARELEEYDKTEYLLVPSDAVKKTFTDRGFTSDRIRSTRYGCDLGRFTPGNQATRSDNDPIRFVFLGRCEPRKGLHTALEAWRQAALPGGYTFTIAGNFVPGYRDFLGNLLNLPGVETKAFVSNPAALLQDADALILPSVEEGSALVTYEAMASGCALLVTKETGSVVEHGLTGLVHPPRSPAELADHLRLFADDRPKLRQMQRAVMERRETLSWLEAGRTLISAYGETRRKK